MTAPAMKPSTLLSAQKQYVGKYNEILCGLIWLYVIPVTSAADKLSGGEMKQFEADQRFSNILLWFLSIFAFTEGANVGSFSGVQDLDPGLAACQL